MTLAGLCNALFAPLGYFVIGAWRTGLIVSALVVVIGFLLFQFTLANPPGIYALGPQPLLGLQLGAMALFGCHAAWLARRSTPKGPLLLRVGSGLMAGVALIALGLAIRAYWPVSIYDAASASMQPSLREGDVVAVRGARTVCGRARPEPGQAVVYIRPGTNTRYMHRVIAGPGRTVTMNGPAVTIDGRVVPEQVWGRALGDGPDGPGQATLAREQLGSGESFTVQHLGEGSDSSGKAVALQADQWFLMGDNRENALDSRLFGPVPTTALCGVAFKVLRSHDPARVGKQP